MSRVEIHDDGRKVIIDHDGDLAQLTDAAWDLWTKTAAPAVPDTGLGSGRAGFQADRRATPAAEPSSMRRPPAQTR